MTARCGLGRSREEPEPGLFYDVVAMFKSVKSRRWETERVEKTNHGCSQMEDRLITKTN